MRSMKMRRLGDVSIFKFVWMKAWPKDSLAEWSKALAQGASPQGRGFEPHSCHLIYVRRTREESKVGCHIRRLS